MKTYVFSISGEKVRTVTRLDTSQKDADVVCATAEENYRSPYCPRRFFKTSACPVPSGRWTRKESRRAANRPGLSTLAPMPYFSEVITHGPRIKSKGTGRTRAKVVSKRSRSPDTGPGRLTRNCIHYRRI